MAPMKLGIYTHRWVKNELDSGIFLHIPAYTYSFNNARRTKIKLNRTKKPEKKETIEMNKNENNVKEGNKKETTEITNNENTCIYVWNGIESDVSCVWQMIEGMGCKKRKAYIEKMCCFSLFVCTKICYSHFHWTVQMVYKSMCWEFEHLYSKTEWDQENEPCLCYYSMCFLNKHWTLCVREIACMCV